MNQWQKFWNNRTARIVFPAAILFFIYVLIFQPDFTEWLGGWFVKIVIVAILAVILLLLIKRIE